MVENYRQIKVKYMGPTNSRGARICIYEPARYNDETTKRIYLGYDYSVGCIQEQALAHLKSIGFNIVGRASEFANYIFFTDNWADDYVELKNCI